MYDITAVERCNGLLAITSTTKKIHNKDIIGITAEHITLKKMEGNVMLLTDEETDEINHPHPSKVAAEGKPTLTLPRVIFTNETSGNKTKKWNQLETYSMYLASLPRKETTKFSNINFICVSNLVNSTNLGKAMAEDLKNLEHGMLMYDASTKENVFVQCPVLCVVCDNPKASEVSHHLGIVQQIFSVENVITENEKKKI